MASRSPITVIIPTYQRLDKLPITLKNILACDPQPSEIIIHVDGNDTTTEKWLQDYFPQIKVIKSQTRIGPGGGRNAMIEAANNPIIASFDDDSYPLDGDYFTRLTHLFQCFPEAGIIGATIFHQGETPAPDTLTAFWTADFVGCGCAYRKGVFLETTGYVALPLAYGMEESDLSLRLHGMGWKIVTSSWLRVVHNTKLKHHENAQITAANIANQALLTYLRYPTILWGLGMVQWSRKVLWFLQHQRYKGILKGISLIPWLLWTNREHRQSLRPHSIFSYLRLRKHKIEVQRKLEI